MTGGGDMASYLNSYVLMPQNLWMLVNRLVAICSIGFLSYRFRCRPRGLRVTQLSLAMWAYLAAHFIGSWLSLPYTMYKIFWWKSSVAPPVLGIYEPYALFWTGMLQMGYNISAPVTVLFLAIDRICALKPAELIGRNRKNIALFGVFLAIAFYVFTIVSWAVEELPLKLSAVSDCLLATCETIKYHNVLQLSMKMWFGTINFISSIVFLVLFKKRTSSDGASLAKCSKTRVAKFSIACALLLDLLPTYIGFMWSVLMGYSLSNVLGDYMSFAVSVEDVAVGLYYCWVFLVSSANKEPTLGPTKKDGANTAIHPNQQKLFTNRQQSQQNRRESIQVIIHPSVFAVATTPRLPEHSGVHHYPEEPEANNTALTILPSTSTSTTFLAKTVFDDSTEEQFQQPQRTQSLLDSRASPIFRITTAARSPRTPTKEEGKKLPVVKLRSRSL